MNITVDTDRSLNFETNGYFRSFLNLFFVPILNILPLKSQKIIKMSHGSVNEVINNATTHVALEVLYKNGHKHHTKSFVQKISHYVWFNTSNSKAVRNRLKLVIRELTNRLIYLKENKTKINIVSIASGSARAVIESIKLANISDEFKLSTTFLDKNPDALKYSENMLDTYKVENTDAHSFTWKLGTAGAFVKSLEHNTCDIIEMVGLLDYFDDSKALDIFKDIYTVLADDGMFITANVCPNSEQKFLTKVVDWSMIYRSADDLGKILLNAGFKKENVKIYYEPLKVHCVAVAVKK